jgi:hypothetical protein
MSLFLSALDRGGSYILNQELGFVTSTQPTYFVFHSERESLEMTNSVRYKLLQGSAIANSVPSPTVELTSIVP